MLENIPLSVRERLARLSRENKQLKAKVGNKELELGGQNLDIWRRLWKVLAWFCYSSTDKERVECCGSRFGT